MKQAVFTSFDELYADYAIVLVKTFCENYSGEGIDFYCLTPENIRHLEQDYVDKCGNPSNVNIKFVTIDAQKEIEKTITDDDIRVSYITTQCFHRLFIADAFPDLDTAIYIDPDTIILRDVQPLLDYPLPAPIAAKSDIPNLDRNFLNNQDLVYFNNGVYKTDLNFWRENQISSKMMKHLQEHGVSLYPEQDLMNLFLAEHRTELSPTLNFFSWLSTVGFFRDTVPDPMIVHFCGPDKPWKNHTLEKKWSSLWREKYQQIFNEDITKRKEFFEAYG